MQAAKRFFIRRHRRIKRSGFGVATVYRMINALEEIGAISRKNMYRIESGENCEGGCDIVLEDDTVFRMPKEKLDQIVRDGARRCGYLSDRKKVSRIIYHDRQR